MHSSALAAAGPPAPAPYVFGCVCVCVCLCVHVCMYVCMYVYKLHHMYIYIIYV